MFAPLFSSAAMRAVVDERARVQRMLDFAAALARAEAAVGAIPALAAGEIAEACKADRYDVAALSQAALTTGTIAVPLIEALTAEVARRNAKSAEFVHFGADTQDIVDTALVLELRAAIDVLLEDLDRATKSFTTLAGRHRRTMTVARTLLQHALPMPFGLKLAGYAAALSRSRERLRRMRREVLALQFGGAAGTLASLGDHGLDVSERLAALLDLPLPEAPWHSQRDRLAEIASTLAILAGTCGKIARDVTLLMQTEVGEAAERHNRIPTAATAALSAAMIAPNLAATILTAQIQEHERAAGSWQTEWTTFPALLLVVSGTLHAVADIADGLDVDVERMRSNLERNGGQIMAEAVAAALADKLGRSEARELVAELSKQAEAGKRSFRELLEADERVKAHLDAGEITRLMLTTSYQGSAQTFIDKLVASATGRAIRRPPVKEPAPPMVEPKLPLAATIQSVTAAVGELKALSGAKPTPAPTAPAPIQPVEAPPVTAAAEPLPAVDERLPAVEGTQSTAEEEPSALLEFFNQAAETPVSPAANDERKQA